MSTVEPNHSASALVIAASDKAGMDGIDRARIDAIILRESGDSAYMKQQRKRDEAVNVKIQQMKQKLAQHERNDSNAAIPWRLSLERQLDSEIEELLKARRPRSTCVVVDMDMFYMACELLTRPDLNDVPACVGSGMILTSNYCARRFGVRSAMAGWIADKLVSELTNGKQRLIHIPSHFELYTQKSHQVRQVLAEYDPQLRAYSLDEAYLDLGPYASLYLDNPEWTHEQIRDALKEKVRVSDEKSTVAAAASAVGSTDEQPPQDTMEDDDLSRFPSRTVLTCVSKVVNEMRQKVKEATGGLTCSAGLASNFMLAKIASDFNKPDGLKVVGPAHEDVLDFVHQLPTRKIPGIGRVTDKMLQAFNITNVKQLYEQRALVRFLFTPATAKFLLRAALGCSSNDHNGGEQSERKGISRERTFQAGRPWSEVSARLEDIARKLSSDMKEKNLRAHTMTVKVKLDTFDVLNRSRSMARGVYLQEPDEMVKLAAELVMELKRQHKGSSFSVRLLGVRCSNFQGEDERDSNQTNIELFLSKDKKRAASPTPLSRGVGVMNASNKRASPSLPTSSPAVGEPSNEPPAAAEPESSTLIQHCPLCGQAIREGNDNDAVNRHIDSCLNSTVVRQAIQEESMAASARQEQERSSNKKQRLTDFFQSSTS